MPPETEISPLASLEPIPYLDAEGHLPTQLEGKIGVYAIFDQAQTLQLISYSRDIYLSLKQHLVRQPQRCYWVKVQTINRPSRTALENIQTAWLAEHSLTPPGNGPDQAKWNQPIDVKAVMTPEEQAHYADPEIDEQSQRKVLKNAARRVEAAILAELKARQVQEDLRFNPKLKDVGLLDLK
ncbi:MAG TPA: GIY-YIG nuclease family protein [Candidatus Caenarcaniphilales bacterium]